MNTQTENSKYRYYVLLMLALTYASSYMDRQIVSILLGDLKAEFDLNDTQLGLLSGLAFAIFYATLAIPIARLADRHNRITIISIAMFLWSIVTVLCAAVTNFVQLLLCRIGVGVGEAGGTAPSHSVISDYFNEQERSLAISLFSLGTAMGAFIGISMGGYISDNYGWRWAFVAAGLPGLVLAIVIKFTVKEPVRGAMESKPDTEVASEEKASEEEKENFMEAAKSLFTNKIYVGAVVAHVLAVFVMYSFVTWLPEVMLRNFDVTKTQVGAIVGLMFLFGGSGGILLGGYLATRLTARHPKWQLLVPTIGLSISVPFYYLALNASSFYSAVVLFGCAFLFFNWQHGPGLAVVQSYVKPHQRATAASLNFFFSNMLGLGLGPLIVGAISDGVAATHGAASLNYALGIMVLMTIPAAIIFYLTSRLLVRK